MLMPIMLGFWVSLLGSNNPRCFASSLKADNLSCISTSIVIAKLIGRDLDLLDRPLGSLRQLIAGRQRYPPHIIPLDNVSRLTGTNRL
jgi:hypothetical protein